MRRRCCIVASYSAQVGNRVSDTAKHRTGLQWYRMGLPELRGCSCQLGADPNLGFLENQSINQLINQVINQSVNQSINHATLMSSNMSILKENLAMAPDSRLYYAASPF